MFKPKVVMFFTLIIIAIAFSCSGPDSDQPVLTAEVPLHLEEHLDDARIVGSEVPEDVPAPVEWRFDEPQPDWRALPLGDLPFELTQLSRTEDALRVILGKSTEEDIEGAVGALCVDVPDWTRDDWSHVQVRARTSDKVDVIGVAFNLREESDNKRENEPPWRYSGDTAPVIRDGSVQTYSLQPDWSGGQWEGKWRQLFLYSFADDPGSIDILSVTVVPKEVGYADKPAGVREEIRNRVYRRALFNHTPGRLEYQVRVPESGRLDLGLGVLRADHPVTFRVTAGTEGGAIESLLDESYADKENWGQRMVDLSDLAGQTVTLALESSCEREGSVALWGSPTLTGSPRSDKPNVIFYVIDGGAADSMSVYGCNRRTTPNLERLAAEGALFEWAFSNSPTTVPSTASFMTSLQNSVMGGQRDLYCPVPEQVLTMAEHMHRAGYQTGVFIANPNAGTLNNLQRGVDLMKESWEEFAYYGRESHKESSRYLHQAFWNWRENCPGQPYWTHFQTTDVHAPQDLPVPAPFSGLFVSPEELKTWKEWGEKLHKEGGYWAYSNAWSKAWEKTGIDRMAFFRIWQALYDQALAHTDHQLGRMVERLKAEGEWENILLIVAADHSTAAAGADIGLLIQETLPPRWSDPMFRPSITRIPLLFVWPGHIKGSQRIDQPVSMIDVLPTILDLVDLPMPEVMMGQSLAPLLLGTAGWEPRPVIFDRFWFDRDSDMLRGWIEVVDGRWGASLEINPEPPKEDEDEVLWRRPVPLLLYDRWNDYYCLNSIHEERPDLVEKYTKFLEAQWEVHQALAQHFTRPKDSPLTPEQLETLRSLGYIR